MAEVLSLKGRRRPAREPVRRDAEIVLFTGVRVEYHETPAPPRRPADQPVTPPSGASRTA